MNSRRIAALAAVAAGGLVAAPSAFATDYCVVPATACTAPNTLPSVQGALTTAVFHPGDDRVLLGAATYSNASGFQYSGSPGNSVELIGAGPGTTLTSTDLAGTTLAFGSGTVRDLSLTATHAQGATGHVLALHSAVADHVTASGSGRGVELSGAKLAHSTISNDQGHMAVETGSAGGSIEDSDIEAKHSQLAVLAQRPLTVARTRIEGQNAIEAGDTDVHVTDSLIFVHPDLINSGLVAALDVDASAGPATGSLVNSTVVGDGGPLEFGVATQAQNSGSQASVTVDNSVFTGLTRRFYRRSLNAGPVSLVARNNDLQQVPDLDQGGPGSIDADATNLQVDPKFADPASGDFHLAPGSPLIDRGSPSPAGGLGSADRDGGARSLDGDGDGTAAPDIGAFESPAVPVAPPAPGGGAPAPGPGTPAGPPDGAPILSKLTLKPHRFKRGVRVARSSGFRFRLSEPGRVRITIKRGAKRAGALTAAGRTGANRVAFRGRLRHRALRPARYVAVAVAIDAGGHGSVARKVRFRVTR